MPTIFDTIRIVKNIFKSKIVNDEEFLRSTVIYNTKENLIILLSFGPNHFYSIIQLMEAINSMPDHYFDNIRCILSHTAVEKELTGKESTEFEKKPVTMIDNKYYLLISSSAAGYAKLFDYIDQSNAAFAEIVKDIYHYCDSAIFQKLIDIDILQLSKFTYKKIVPKYDEHIHFNNTLKMSTGKFDDIDKICSRLPNSYNRIDLARIFNIYDAPKSIVTLKNLVLLASEYDVEAANTDPYYYALFKVLSKSDKNPFYKIMPNATLETLQAILLPIYLREDFDDENQLNGDLPIESLDTIFQQEYERFVNPTADAGIEYEAIDEKIDNNAETNNMRPEDIIEDTEEFDGTF